MTLGKQKPEKKAKKRKNPSINKMAVLVSKYGEYVGQFGWPECECGCGDMGEDLHHGLIHRMKGVPYFDDERNLVLITHKENVDRKYDNLAGRKKFWKIQVRRYGLDVMMEWVNNIPEKYKSRVDWL